MTDSTGPGEADIPAYVQQLARTYRFLDRYKQRRTVDILREPERFNELEDFLWAFFQNCWHVNDWIRNDDALPKLLRAAVWDDVRASRELQIVADLANGSKHFSRDPGREWIGATESQINFSLAPNGQFSISHEIELPNGERLSALDAAEHAMSAWTRILKLHSMSYISEPTGL